MAKIRSNAACSKYVFSSVSSPETVSTQFNVRIFMLMQLTKQNELLHMKPCTVMALASYIEMFSNDVAMVKGCSTQKLSDCDGEIR
jgi:hypothetical protein